MLGKLVNKLRKQTITDKAEDELPVPPEALQRPQLRKSARLSAQKSSLHDSGTESDDEELERLEQEKVCDENTKMYGDFLNSRSPPAMLNSPPLVSEIDTESWDSTGGESGITAGFESNECSRESADCPTPPPAENVRRGAFTRTSYSKGQCEFPPMSMHNTGEKRRHSMTANNRDQPIASRLRSNNESPRDIIVAARRTPVKILVHRPSPQLAAMSAASKPIPIMQPKKAEEEFGSFSPPHPVAKRNRTNNYGRPTLDLDKMLEHRFSSDNFVPVGDDESGVNQKEDWLLPSTCQHGSAVPCAQANCLFRPVFFDEKTNEPKSA